MTTPATGLHSLATIIKRLEAATSRLEDVVATQGTLTGPPAVPTISIKGTGPAFPPPPTAPPPPPPPPVQQAPVVAETPKSVVAFDEQIIEGKLKSWLKISKELEIPTVAEIADLVEKEYNALRAFLLVAASCQKPTPLPYQTLPSELEEAMKTVIKGKENHRGDREWFEHIAFVAEAATAAGWIAHPTPAPFIDECKQQAEFYGFRVMKNYKEKLPKHVEWVRGYLAILLAMKNYVKEFHTTGLVWNPKGVPYAQYQAPGTAPPPPPPPPPPPVAAPTSGGGGAAAVFAELNKGEAITKSLRKVDKSEMTHKNPALRAGSIVPASPSASPTAKKPVRPTKPIALAGKKPSKFVLDGNKWLIEYQENESVTVENGEINQSVNIFNCKNTTIIIQGKVNAVTIHNSVKTSVLIESVVSSISVTASPSFTLQVTGSAPMIQVDSTDSGQIYLSKTSLHTEVTTAKCSSINISLPVQGEEDGVFEEQPIPEMLKTVIQDGKLVTTIVEHAG